MILSDTESLRRKLDFSITYAHRRQRKIKHFHAAGRNFFGSSIEYFHECAYNYIFQRLKNRPMREGSRWNNSFSSCLYWRTYRQQQKQQSLVPISGHLPLQAVGATWLVDVAPTNAHSAWRHVHSSSSRMTYEGHVVTWLPVADGRRTIIAVAP